MLYCRCILEHFADFPSIYENQLPIRIWRIKYGSYRLSVVLMIKIYNLM